MKWMLLVFVMSPDDQYQTKVVVPFPTQEACQASVNAMPEHSEDGGFWDAVCVTEGHYNGTEYMEDAPLDWRF